MLTHAVLHREVPRPNSFCSFLLQSELPNQVRRSVLPSGVFAQEITADAWVPLTDFLLSPQLVGHKCLSSGQVFLRFFWFSDLQFFQIFFSFFQISSRFSSRSSPIFSDLQVSCSSSSSSSGRMHGPDPVKNEITAVESDQLDALSCLRSSEQTSPNGRSLSVQTAS